MATRSDVQACNLWLRPDKANERSAPTDAPSNGGRCPAHLSEAYLLRRLCRDDRFPIVPEIDGMTCPAAPCLPRCLTARPPQRPRKKDSVWPPPRVPATPYASGRKQRPKPLSTL